VTLPANFTLDGEATDHVGVADGVLAREGGHGGEPKPPRVTVDWSREYTERNEAGAILRILSAIVRGSFAEA